MHILEVRAAEPPRPVTITAAIRSDASRAIFVALSEQLDRRRRDPVTTLDDVCALRERIALVERFAPLASAGGHTIAQFADAELRACLLDLTDYADRVDGEHFQAAELRERLQVIAQLIPVFWETNTAATAAGAAPLALAAH